jgi:hypothetical protein
MEGSSGSGGLTGGPKSPAISISRPNGRGQLSVIPAATSRTTPAATSPAVRSRLLRVPAEGGGSARAGPGSTR